MTLVQIVDCFTSQFFAVLSIALAIKCHICSTEEECNNPTLINCDETAYAAGNEEANACMVEWTVDKDGKYNIVRRGCGFGRGSVTDNGPHDCDLRDDGSGLCYCNKDSCNDEASSNL